MRRFIPIRFFRIILFAFFILISFSSKAQVLQIEILGGSVVTEGSTVTINAGSNLTFRATNVETSNCSNLQIEDVDISNTTDFNISPNNPNDKIKPSSCKGDHYLDFAIRNISGICTTTSTLVTIEIKNQADFTFTLEVNSSPEINVLGGSPSADITNGSTITSSTNGTYFGIVEEGASITRYYIIANTGSCPLNISAISSSSGDFSVPGYVLLPIINLPTAIPTIVIPGSYVILPVTFTGPVAGTGTQTSTISITNTANTTFTFDVSAEMFNYSIPGPGGITADFRLWLKSTRGITTTGSTLTNWIDVGTNAKNAATVSGKEPTYVNTPAENINFNPVVKFVNNGGSTEQYMYNNDSPLSGFYSADIFIVMIPDATMTNASSQNTIFAGVESDTAGDVTGLGYGDYSTAFTNETLSYNQDIPGTGTFNGIAEINSTYSNVGIINIRNNTTSTPTGQEILYNSNLLTTSTVTNSFANINGSKYWIGKNRDGLGSLNGRIAEIFTFGTRVDAAGRQKIESYLAIKYGITLGASTIAQKDYVNSFNKLVWDITANAGFNYHIAGIGRDDDSDLNQKQSKTINTSNEVTIGLNGIFSVNSTNPNEFNENGDFLVWGCNNAGYTGSSTNTITIASGITTSLTRIDRKWKIVESIESGSGGDVENVYISIPSAAFSSFPLGANEEYALIVADNSNFSNADIIDVIPLKPDGVGNLTTWYDFDGAKYFTFGKALKLSENHSVSIASGDYLVGEYALNLNINDFTISAWIKNNTASASPRTIMSKGNKLQLRLNTSNEVEVMVDNAVTPRFTSTMQLNDGKWHQITFVYISGTIFLYIDGVLDKSEQNVTAPSPNFNRFALGALYIDKNSITNPFLGEIDEVYVWDQGLTESQVRYLMNQEVEKVTGNFVSGKVIPSASSCNEVSTIAWSKLKAYYDFNSFYGSTVEGLTDDRNFLRLKYLVKDKTIVEAQTSPLPYISAADGDWDTGTTWLNIAHQIIPNTLSLDGTTSIDWNIVQISHEIASGDRDISLLGLKSNSGTLTVADPIDAQNETNSGQELTITHYLELDGVIDLVGESQLLQTEGSIIDADSGGYIEKDQQGTANGFNYNYWSSSVGPIGGNTATRGTGVSSTNSNYTISGVLNDGTNSGLYQSLLYNTSLNGSGSIPPPGFARTISTRWLYTFYGPADDYNAWAKIDESSSLIAGEGYSMKGTGGSAAIPISTLQNYVFKGLPNNGDITLELDKSSGDVERLIGNPYPSAIDAIEFILDNISTTEGGNNANTVINGALYFWDHFGQENSHLLKSYVGGYATYNLIGGAQAISNDARINNNNTTGSKIPGQFIPVNQAFFVSTKLESNPNDNSGTISSVDGGTIIFKNSQRVYAIEDGTSSLFMKSSKDKTSSKIVNNKPKNITPTIRLVYHSPLGYHRQLVIGANKKASNGYNLGYDAFMVDVNEEDMYWTFNNNKFVIQGVGDFNSSQEFSLGLIVKDSGMVKIKLDALENIETDIPVFIKDELTGETKNINTEPFEVNLEPGVYNDRFKLVFSQTEDSTSIVESVANENTVFISYDSKSSILNLINTDERVIKDFVLYDILGNELKTLKLNIRSNISIPVSVITGLYIVKLNTEKGVVTKKVIIE